MFRVKLWIVLLVRFKILEKVKQGQTLCSLMNLHLEISKNVTDSMHFYNFEQIGQDLCLMAHLMWPMAHVMPWPSVYRHSQLESESCSRRILHNHHLRLIYFIIIAKVSSDELVVFHCNLFVNVFSFTAQAFYYKSSGSCGLY